MGDAGEIPLGFEPFIGRSSFAEAWQPLYERVGDEDAELGLYLDGRHCNSRGVAHGGLITALADNAMGIAAERQSAPGRRPDISGVITVHLDIDFMAPGSVGSWLQFRATCASGEGSLRFAACSVFDPNTVVARVSGVYRVVGTPEQPRRF